MNGSQQGRNLLSGQKEMRLLVELSVQDCTVCTQVTQLVLLNNP